MKWIEFYKWKKRAQNSVQTEILFGVIMAKVSHNGEHIWIQRVEATTRTSKNKERGVGEKQTFKLNTT